MKAFLLWAILVSFELPAQTYRVLVSTDLGGDPDDIQSLYRLLHYSDILRIEGIVSSPGPGAENSVDKIRDWIRQIDVDALRARGHESLIKQADALALVKQGQLKPGAPARDRRTVGSDWIISRAHARDPEGKNRILWVLVWGSITDVAQALHDDPTIAAKIRIYYIGSSNTMADEASRDWVYHFMTARTPDLWWIENGVLPRRSHDTFRGVYQGGDQSGEWGNQEFVNRNIRQHGEPGKAFPFANSPKGTLKEGDSPSMLYLLSPVLGKVGNVDDPTQESWGGQFRRPDNRYLNYYTDLNRTAEECQATISKWRRQFLSDWKRRWAWYSEPVKAP
jgi:hypothetical protein